MFREIKERFVTDRNYAIGKTLLVVATAVCILSVFLVTKIVTEVTSWYETSGEYASNTINVDAMAEVVAVPDVATFNFGVVEESESVEQAQESASKKMNLAIAFLKENGIEEKDIKTTDFSANPKYQYSTCRSFDCPPSTRELVGYEVRQTVQVKVRDTSKAGQILAGITSQEVSNISGLSFTVDDTEALKEQARNEAVQKARAKAEALADSLGVKIKKLVSFSEDSSGGPIYMEAKAYGIGGSADSAIAPELPVGENTITSRVYITYEIK